MSNVDENKNGFQGFVPPTSNFYKTPNIWIDICAEINNLAELKVVQYVLRHTWGYQEYEITKAITTDEFMHGRKRGDNTRMDKGTGLSNRSVIDGLRKAVDDGYLVCEIDDSDKARIIKSYALKMQSPASGVKDLHTTSYEESTQPAMKKLHTAVKHVHSNCERSSQRSEKDTSRKTPKKDTERKKEDSQRNQSPKQETPPSLFSSEIKNEWYVFFDTFYRSKEGYAADFKVPRTKKNDESIASLIEANATHEQTKFVFNDIWEDKDAFWKQHRTISSVASQFPVRVVKMSKPKTLGGYTIYQPDPKEKELPFMGTERQRKERQEEQKNIPTEQKPVYDKVYQCIQELGGSIQYAHEEAREVVKFYGHRGVSYSKDEFDTLVDAIMEEIKAQNEIDYVAQNRLTNSVLLLPKKTAIKN